MSSNNGDGAGPRRDLTGAGARILEMAAERRSHSLEQQRMNARHQLLLQGCQAAQQQFAAEADAAKLIAVPGGKNDPNGDESKVLFAAMAAASAEITITICDRITATFGKYIDDLQQANAVLAERVRMLERAAWPAVLVDGLPPTTAEKERHVSFIEPFHAKKGG